MQGIFYFSNRFVIIHNTIPHIVGRMIARRVHFSDFVSAFMVIHVVAQGQCININSIVLIAVTGVHPFATKSSLTEESAPTSVKTVPEPYIIIISGITISLAGNPIMNAVKIVPSSPINLPRGSSVEDICAKTDKSFISMFEANQIINPAGAAAVIARPRTKRVLSKMDLTMIFPN